MIHSFLLIGQSNMAGRGYLQEARDIDTSRIKLLKNGRWWPMFRPINPDRSFAGTSLAESFAEAYAKKYNVDVGLICCADGGTTLAQWQPGGLLFDNAVYQAKLAQRTSTIAGVLWHQGEGDTKMKELADTYLPRFQIFMDTLRKELDLQDVPFLVGGLGGFIVNYETLKDGKPFFPLKHLDTVNRALEQATKQNHRTAFVSAKGLTANPDSLHFNAASLYEFGLRYFEAFEKIADPNRIFVKKPNPDDALRSEMEAL